MLRICDVTSAQDVETVRVLLREYVTQLGVNLDFQHVDDELTLLPGAYVRPRGRLLLATYAGEPVGCIAMRATADGRAEMKRLYVRDAARGLGVGKALVERIMRAACEAGYDAMVLDTLATMTAAQRMYERVGFADVPPYTANPLPRTQFLGLALPTQPVTMCAECGARYFNSGDDCSARFDALLALDHQRVEPYGRHHGEAFAAFALSHPERYAASLDRAWEALHAIHVRGSDSTSIFAALRATFAMPDGRTAPARQAARMAMPAVTIAECDSVAPFEYPVWLASWCEAVLRSWGVSPDD